jgi:hypothetical protein
VSTEYLFDGHKKNRPGEHHLPAVIHFGETGLIVDNLISVNAFFYQGDIWLLQPNQLAIIEQNLCIKRKLETGIV